MKSLANVCAQTAILSFVLLCSILSISLPLPAQSLTLGWVELGDGGKAIARIVVNHPGDCPLILINGLKHHMAVREPVPDGFHPVCEFEVPPGTNTATINFRALVLPKPDPERVVVLGDTGCRIKGNVIQNCNDPEVWPFKKITQSVEIEKPGVVIHVGDYLYRESPCPAESKTFCGGTPIGDNWDAWNADFFTPAARLLGRAPWVFTRGNHEDCDRSWRGWFYYLDPRPWTGTCEAYSLPYSVKMGKFELAVLDTSAVKENDLDEKQVSTYADQLMSLHSENAWLVSHHPFWGFTADKHGGKAVSLVESLQAAWEKAAPTGFNLIVSGHVHLFEYVSTDHGRPSQLVAGDGGTALGVPVEISTKESKIRGATVVASRTLPQYGYTLLTHSGDSWKLELKNQKQEVMVTCTLPGSSANCQGGAN